MPTSLIPKQRVIFLLLFICAVFMPAGSSAGPLQTAKREKPSEVKDIKAVSQKDYASVYIDFSKRPDYRIKSQISRNLLHIEIKNATLNPGIPQFVPVNDGKVKGVEAIEYDRELVRITIKFEPGVNHKVSYEEKETFVLTIDARPAVPEKEPLKETKPQEEHQLRPYSLNLSGYLKNETAYRIADPADLAKVRNIFFLASSGEIRDGLSYLVSGRAVYDAVFDITGDYPQAVEDDQEFEADLRDAYIDFSRGDWDLRLGKQQIVWGEAVGLFFADVVNAKDLREFVLPDFEYLRIPQWAADMEYTKDSLHLEFVWIPVLQFNDLGQTGSEFPQAIPVPAGVSAVSRGISEPSNSLENGELGARASYLVDGWDFSLFHFYGWDRFPANIREVTAPLLHTFSPEHKRLNITGATFAKEIKDLILKGEFIYNKGKYFSVIDENDQDGVIRKDFLDYLIGFDYTFFEKVDFNFQFMQRVIFGYDERIFREDRVRTSASVWLKTGFLDNAIEPEILVISSLREQDMLIRPKVSFKFKDHWQARIGLDIFEGVSDGLFGQYDDKDRVYAEARYDF